MAILPVTVMKTKLQLRALTSKAIGGYGCACVLVALAVVLLGGCVSVGDNNSNDLPWTAPAGWENQTLGVPL